VAWSVLTEDLHTVKSGNHRRVNSMDDVLPINTLFDGSFGPNLKADFDPRVVMRQAELIIAVDVMCREESPVYGGRLLTEIVTGKTPNRELRTVKISLDMESEELAKLPMLVFVAKGVVDYRPHPKAKVPDRVFKSCP
jgi:hypothetical protein